MIKIYSQPIDILEQGSAQGRIMGQSLELTQTQTNPNCLVLGQSVEFTQTQTNPSCHVVGQSIEFTQTTTNPVCRVVGQSIDFIELTSSTIVTSGVYMEVLRTPDNVSRPSPISIVVAT